MAGAEGNQQNRNSAGLQPLSALPPGLYRSAPLAADSDFTAEDPLAMDYLGQQVGLWLFPGLTTRTSRAQYYAVVAYGLDLVEKAIAHYGYHADDQTRVRLFERWERFWALAVLELREGVLPRSDPDGMRGVRGATNAWRPGDRALPLDYALISRQSELGGLGAYLSSLRYHDLVFPGTLRATPAAKSIVDGFWDEPGTNQKVGRYEEYSLDALDLDRKTIPRTFGRLSLAKVGRKSRLSCLTARSRAEQQQRLWEMLFGLASDDSTLPLAELLISAAKGGVTDPEELLAGFSDGRWGDPKPAIQRKVQLALSFGRCARELLDRFSRAYGAVDKAGWVEDIAAVAHAAFPERDMRQLRNVCREVLSADDAARFRGLEFHGPGFLHLLEELADAAPESCLRSLLRFHHGVHRSRRGGGAWISEQEQKLTLQVTSYRGHLAESSFPGLKLNAVRSLLVDVGRIA